MLTTVLITALISFAAGYTVRGLLAVALERQRQQGKVPAGQNNITDSDQALHEALTALLEKRNDVR